MLLTQRGVLPPVNFDELDNDLQSSMLSPAGTREIALADLTATMEASILAPAGTKTVAQADLGATLASSILAPSGSKTIDAPDMDTDFYEAGTFTLSPGVGWSADPTALTVSYVRLGNLVMLCGGVQRTGTSDVNTMDWTGLPATLRPNAVGRDVPCTVIDNGAAKLAVATLQAGSSQIIFSICRTDTVANYVTPVTNGFTASGTKGLPDVWNLCFMR